MSTLGSAHASSLRTKRTFICLVSLILVALAYSLQLGRIHAAETTSHDFFINETDATVRMEGAKDGARITTKGIGFSVAEFGGVEEGLVFLAVEILELRPSAPRSGARRACVYVTLPKNLIENRNSYIGKLLVVSGIFRSFSSEDTEAKRVYEAIVAMNSYFGRQCSTGVSEFYYVLGEVLRETK